MAAIFDKINEENNAPVSGNVKKSKKVMLDRDGKPMSKAAIKRALRYTPLQRCYLDACKKIRTVVPDSSIVHELKSRRLVAELDHHDPSDIDAINQFMLTRYAQENISGIDFSFGNTGSSRHMQTAAMATQKNRIRLTRTISQCMQKARNLKSLDIFGLKLGTTEVEMLSAGFTNNQTCKRFLLRKSHIGDKSLVRLASSLATSQVNVLSLIDNDLTDDSALVIARILKAHVSRREEYMWTCSLRLQPGDDTDVQPHSIQIAENSLNVVTMGLLSLDLSYNKFGDKTAHIIADHLKCDRYLLGLTMRNCRVTANGVNSIMQTIKRNPLSPLIMCQFDTTKITKTKGGRELMKELDDILASHKDPPIMSFEPVKSVIKRRENLLKVLSSGAPSNGVAEEEKKTDERSQVEIEEFVKFMDELGSNTGELSRTDFIAAFRQLKREIAMCHDKIEGSRLTLQLLKILEMEYSNLSKEMLVTSWIGTIASTTHHALYEGRVSRLQLVREIKRLNERHTKFNLSSSQIIQLMRFIDVDGDDDLDRYEIEQAFIRAANRSYFALLESHEQVLWLLEKHMKQNHWGVPELFRAIDADGSGALSLEEIGSRFAEWGFVDDSKLETAKNEIGKMYKDRGKKRTEMLVGRKAQQLQKAQAKANRRKINVRRNLKGEITKSKSFKPVLAQKKKQKQKKVPVEAQKDAIKIEDMSDIMKIAAFCRHVDAPPIGNGDGTLSQMELQDAFRKLNQERAVAIDQEIGMNAFGNLYDCIQNLYGNVGRGSLLRWFQEFDTSNAGRGDGSLSKNELRVAVRRLMNLDQEFFIDEDTLIKMLSFVDVNGNDDIGVDELTRAEELLVAEENMPQAQEIAVHEVFNKVKAFMLHKHWRVVDLFRHIDVNDSTKITMKEFRQALEKWNILIDPEMLATQELAETAGAIGSADGIVTGKSTGEKSWLDADIPFDAPIKIGDNGKTPVGFIDFVFTDTDGGAVDVVTLPRLEEIVRHLHRLRDTEDARRRAEDLIRELFEAVVCYRRVMGHSDEPSVAIDEWFKEIDVSQAGRGDGFITRVELREGVRKVQDELAARLENGAQGLPDFFMDEQDLIDMLRYIDTSVDDDLDLKEVHAAFCRALQDKDSVAIATKSCQATLNKLEEALSETKMRIRDFFKEMCLSIERSRDPKDFMISGVVKLVEEVPRAFFEKTLAELGVIPNSEGVMLRRRLKPSKIRNSKSVSGQLLDIRKEMSAMPSTALSEDIEESALERMEERFDQLWDKLERIEAQKGFESPRKRAERPKLAVDKATGRSTKSPSSTFRSSNAMDSPITPGGTKSSDAELLGQLQKDLADRLKDIYRLEP